MAVENVIVQQTMSAAEAFPARPCSDGAVDAWVRRDLSVRYDATLAESLPADMLALLDVPH